MLPSPTRAPDPDLAAEEPGDLAADRQPQAGAAVLPARPRVGLLERLEDDLAACPSGMPMPVSVTENATTPAGPAEDRVVGAPALRSPARCAGRPCPSSVNLNAFESRFRRTCWSRFASVATAAGQALGQLDRERQALGLGHRPEGPLDVVAEVGERDLADLDRHRPRLDLGHVEDVVDQREQVGPGGVDRLRELAPAWPSGSPRRCRRASRPGSAGCSAGSAARATCWPGTRTCTSRSARAARPSPRAPAWPARSRGSCPRPATSGWRAGRPWSRAPRWPASARPAGS